MKDRHQLVSLSGGGQLAYAEYGDPNGKPVFFCHGWPSSHSMAALTDPAACEFGARIISPDRPGLCRSTFKPNRKLLDWPPVLKQLADHLGIERFDMLAVSGGAPYAYVTGWAMPQRVRRIAIVSGAVPLAEISDWTELLPLYRWMMWFYRHQPALLRILFRLASPFVSLRTFVRVAQKLLRTLPESDAAVLRDRVAFDIVFQSQREAWSGSADGVITDAEIYGQPWGFQLEDVSVPVQLWHGKEDRAFSVRIAQEIAARLPDCQTRFIDRAGHYSLPIRYVREIVADLIAA